MRAVSLWLAVLFSLAGLGLVGASCDAPAGPAPVTHTVPVTPTAIGRDQLGASCRLAGARSADPHGHALVCRSGRWGRP
jgi:hypothetical protein